MKSGPGGVVGGALLIAVLAAVVVHTPDARAAGGVVEPGKKALYFGLPDLDGTYQHTKQWFRREKVIVCFFATWCRVCPAEFEFIEENLGSLDGPRPMLLGVAEAPDATSDKVRAYMAQHGIDLDVVLLDGKGRVGRLFGLAETGEVRLPHTLMIDEQGVIVSVIRGFDESTKEEFGRVMREWYGEAVRPVAEADQMAPPDQQ